MEANYSSDVWRLYKNCQGEALPLNEEFALQAGIIVERLYPPKTTDAAFQILASLNLLNAVVKQPWGRQVVSYPYIKGMAADMLLWLLDHPIENVAVYWSAVTQVAFFRVWGIQISFHYIPLSSELMARLSEVLLEPQEWDGYRLQLIAIELFRLAVPETVTYGRSEERYVRYVMRHSEPGIVNALSPKVLSDKGARQSHVPFAENKIDSLHAALHFRIWQHDVFTLWRRKDHRPMPVARYSGNNYRTLMNYLLGTDSRIKRRPRKHMLIGQFYYVSPQKRLRCISRSNYIKSITQNSYLRTSDGYCNLCITYGIARYLGMLYPTLKFVCTLNYNRQCEQRIYYSFNELRNLPVLSQARQLKVWLVVDTANVLKDFDTSSLPQALVDDYLQSEDYYQEFEVVQNNEGLKGLVAYRRHTLLEPLYQRIWMQNYHAHIQDSSGKWAIYSLSEERFKSGFVYTRIWYDTLRDAIIGEKNGRETIIFRFHLERRKQ